MRPTVIFRTLVAAAGLAVACTSGYLIVRGPFLGGPSLDPVPLMVATGGFVAGVVGFALGATTLARQLAGPR